MTKSLFLSSKKLLSQLHQILSRAGPPMGPLAVVRLLVGFPMRFVKKLMGRGGGGGTEDRARWLIVGLGNPGSKFALTRHNVGFDVVDRLAKAEGLVWGGFGENTDLVRLQKKANAKLALGVVVGTNVVLVKPQTFMNLSGESVKKLMKHWRVPKERVLIIYDDLDTPTCVMKLKGKGGHGGHNGVRNIIDECPGCADKTFPRLKIGVGRPKRGTEVYDHVLTKFHANDRLTLESCTFNDSCDVIRGVLSNGLDKTMTAVNNKAGTGGGDTGKAPDNNNAWQLKKTKKPKIDPAVATLVRNAVANVIAGDATTTVNGL
jgi:PTH1 family peptidyl-tRNA hydrolase